MTKHDEKLKKDIKDYLNNYSDGYAIYDVNNLIQAIRAAGFIHKSEVELIKDKVYPKGKCPNCNELFSNHNLVCQGKDTEETTRAKSEVELDEGKICLVIIEYLRKIFDVFIGGSIDRAKIMLRGKDIEDLAHEIAQAGRKIIK